MPCPPRCVLSNIIYASLLYLLIMWLLVSSLSPHDIHLLFCCVLSILALIWLIIMALFCTAVWWDSVSVVNFPFLSHIHVFLCEMSLVSLLKHPQRCFRFLFCFLIISVLLVLMLSVFYLIAFQCSLRVVVSIRQRYIQCWYVPSFLLFLRYIFCQRNLWNVKSYAWSLVFFSGPFV